MCAKKRVFWPPSQPPWAARNPVFGAKMTLFGAGNRCIPRVAEHVYFAVYGHGLGLTYRWDLRRYRSILALSLGPQSGP